MSRSEEFRAGSEDVHTTLPVSALPLPDPLQSDPRRVQSIKRSIQRNGYQPKPDDAPITVLHEVDRNPRIIDGNHRTEALIRARYAGPVPVKLTSRRPDWLPD